MSNTVKNLAQNSDKFTPEQRRVIDSRGKNLIVSAAAGSGKTTTMIERVVNLIQDGASVDELLLVTFTNASSTDMKLKLSAELGKLQPTPHILEQLDLIMNADVSTLHSFCSKLLKTYFYEAGIDPSFVVLSEDETNVIKQDALSKLFDEMFESGNVDFYNLYDMLQKNRSDKPVKEAILRLYDFFNVLINRQKWFDDCIKNVYNPNLSKNRAAGMINSYVCNRISQLLEQVAAKIVKYNELGLNQFVAYLQQVQSTLVALSSRNGFVKNAQILYNISNFGVPPNVDDAMADYRAELDEFRKYLNEELKNFKSNFIDSNTEKLAEQLTGAKNLATALYNATCRFEEIFTALKAEKCGLDYNDLEHYTLKILDCAEILQTLKNKYKYIFVDEYQDINAIQEEIINRISGSNNRFMVGDVKQSIYRFRLCDPEIFIDKYNLYSSSSKDSEAINLFENFRSNYQILNFVNMVFSGRMTKEFGGVDYQKDAQLKAGIMWEEQQPVNICYIDDSTLTEKSKAELQGVYSVKNHCQEEELEHLKGRAEAEYIARKAIDLVANGTIFDAKINCYRGVHWNDIAILVPTRKEVDTIAEVLTEKNIPVCTDVATDVLTDEYVKCIDSYLQVISNWHNDIPLFNVLYSPLFNFSPDELALLRENGKNCKYFYQTLQNITKNTLINAKLALKVQNFMQNLKKYRFLATYKNVQQLAEIISKDFCLHQLLLTQQDGQGRVALLNKYLQSLPQQSLQEYTTSQRATITASQNADSGAVQIVTIHKSKGLEYPVVFVANISRVFNKTNLHADEVISKDYGIGVNYYNQINRFKQNSLAKEAIKLTETRKMIEEQQRLLYVALTRAKNKLFVVGCRNCEKLNKAFPERPNCFADWIDSFVSSFLEGDFPENIKIDMFMAENLIETAERQKKEPIVFAKPELKLQKLLLDGINFEYLYSKAAKTPQKTSVTQIASGYHESEEIFDSFALDKSNYIDDNAELIPKIDNKKEYFAENKANEYINQKNIHKNCKNLPQKSNKGFNSNNLLAKNYNFTAEKPNSATQKGNAYHKFMQYVNFECKTIEELQQNIQSLINSGKLTKQESDFINLQSILNLLTNSAFKALLKQGQVLREREFFMDIGKGDIQIVQGVIDLAIIGQNSIAIIDYKTGNFSECHALQKYQKQISLYAEAAKRCYEADSVQTYICAIEQGKLYKI